MIQIFYLYLTIGKTFVNVKIAARLSDSVWNWLISLSEVGRFLFVACLVLLVLLCEEVVDHQASSSFGRLLCRHRSTTVCLVQPYWHHVEQSVRLVSLSLILPVILLKHLVIIRDEDVRLIEVQRCTLSVSFAVGGAVSVLGLVEVLEESLQRLGVVEVHLVLVKLRVEIRRRCECVVEVQLREGGCSELAAAVQRLHRRNIGWLDCHVLQASSLAKAL